MQCYHGDVIFSSHKINSLIGEESIKMGPSKLFAILFIHTLKKIWFPRFLPMGLNSVTFKPYKFEYIVLIEGAFHAD